MHEAFHNPRPPGVEPPGGLPERPGAMGSDVALKKALELCEAVEAMETERQEARDGRPDDLWIVPPDPKWYRHVLRLAREAKALLTALRV